MYARLRIISVYVKTVKELAENNLKTFLLPPIKKNNLSL